MKKFGYLCALLLCIPELNQAKEPFSQELYAAVGSGVIFGCIGYLCGKRKSELQLRQFEAEQAAMQQKAETEKFHLVEKVTALKKLFSQNRPTKAEQEIEFYNKVIEHAGSVTSFKELLQKYEQDYEKLSPEAAKEHGDIMADIRDIKARLYSNHHAKEAEKTELPEKLSEARLTQKKDYSSTQ